MACTGTSLAFTVNYLTTAPKVQIVTEKLAVGLGSFFFFALGVAGRALFVTSNRFIQFKTHIGLKCGCVLCV